jgi:hypothetical protein
MSVSFRILKLLCILAGGVLVERTVAEVMPAVKNNKEQLAQVFVPVPFLHLPFATTGTYY